VAGKRSATGRAGRSAPAGGGTLQEFRGLVEEYYEQTFERFPIEGSRAGRREFDGELGRARPGDFERQGRLVERILAAVEDLPPQDFDASAMLDRRTFVAALRLEHLNLVELERWRNDPQRHLHAVAESLLELVVRNADRLVAVAPGILSSLRQAPRYFGDAAECLDRPDPLWRELTLEAIPGVISFFNSLAEPLIQTQAAPAGVIRRAVAGACAAVEAYGDAVRSTRPGKAGSFAIGERRLRLLMRDRLGLDWSPREAMAFARREATRIAAELRREAAHFHPRKSPVEILAEAAAAWRPDSGLLEAYTRVTRAVRERFEEAELVSFPKAERLLIKPVPDFLRELFPTAAYTPPGAVDPDQTGIFWVNDPGDVDLPPARRAAEIAQHFGLEMTCAHEAYPGHHLQFMVQHRRPSFVRKLANHAVYYEGWTLWCEQMTCDLLSQGVGRGRRARLRVPGAGLPENPHIRLNQLNDELWRAWRIVIDVGLQTGELTCENARRILQREVGFTAARARADINWYTSAPTIPMSYLIGKAELLRLKRRYVDSGGLTLREFNDWVLSFGAIPWRWIEESGL